MELSKQVSNMVWNENMWHGSNVHGPVHRKNILIYIQQDA